MLALGEARAAVQGLPKPGTDPRRRAAAAADQAQGRDTARAQPAPQNRSARPQGQPDRASARRTPPQTRTQAEPSAATLYWREEFVYPVEGRRNPFENLAESGLGPDFTDLDLVGIIYRPGAAVATLVDRSAKKRYRVRRGDLVGNAEVIEIRSGEVVFNVTVFGVSRVERLRVKKEKETEG